MTNVKTDWYIYIIETSGTRLYTGITTDLQRRFKEHLAGKKSGAKFTRAFKPEKICACWKVSSRSDASKIEIYIKSLIKNDKNKLIEKPKILKSKLKENSIVAKIKVCKLNHGI